MYDFSKLTKDQEEIYDHFLLKLCSQSSPLNQNGSETDLGIIFENELNKLLKDLGFIENGYMVFRHENKNTNGWTDFQYGNTIVEYKKYNLLGKKNNSKTQNIESELEQIQKYLKDPKLSGFKMYGFLFDGTHLYIYTKDENDEIKYDNKSGQLTQKNLKFLINTIFRSGIISISPSNLRQDFGIVCATSNKILNNHEVKDLAKFFFLKLKDEKLKPRTILLYNEWERLFRLAENDNGQHKDIVERRKIFSKIFDELINSDGEYKALFALHTTLSIIIKLLLVRTINDMPNIDSKITLDDFYKTDDFQSIKDFFEKIENGSFFNKIGIINLTDNDFFSWYIKENLTSELKGILQKIIFKICSYENIYIARETAMIDMFKELYLNFIPKVVRHSFGEYYTPYWLAERTLLSTLNGEQDLSQKSFIDPNCGSGTFLSVFFNYKHAKLKNKIDFKEYTKDIVGVDINPIAVLMARANILISGLKKCSFSLNEKYELPVYLADSLYVPKLIKIDDIECFDYELYTTELQKNLNITSIRIVLPKDLVLKPNFLDIISKVEGYIVKRDKNQAMNVFDTEFEPISKSKKLRKMICDVIDRLIQSEQEIWLKIFSNYFRVACYKKFDYIIGNPAWIQWSVLPETYRNNIKANMRLDGLFSSDRNVGGNNLNICALIANKCCERWLDKNGVFCFLMPKSILFNKSFEGFRNLKINNDEQLYLNEVIDFSNAGEVFEGVGQDFCAFKISKKPLPDNNVVPMIDYYKKRNTKTFHNHTWDNTKQNYKEEKKFAVALKTRINNNFLIVDSLDKAKHLQNLIGECEYVFRKGVSVPYQMRLEFAHLKNEKIGVFYPYAKFGNRIKADKDKLIELELEYIKPFVTSPMLKEDGLEWQNSYAICPYKIGTKKPMEENMLKELAPFIYHYLTHINDELGNGSRFNKRVQSFKPNYGILRMGSYTWSKEFVCIRDNTKLAPNHIGSIKTAWGVESTPLFDNHISYISEVEVNKKKRYITKKEAKYILNKLKDKDVNEIIINSQDGRSISSRLPIKLKLYNS